MIRQMHIEDVPAVLAIERKVQSHPWTANQFTESVDSYSSTVIDYQNKVVGFCILQPVLDEANLLLMAVDPEYQGKGLGFELLNRSLDRLPNDPIQIFLEVRESNHAAIKLYEKSGFHQIDTRKNYYPTPEGGKEHAIIMVKMCSDNFTDLFKS